MSDSDGWIRLPNTVIEHSPLDAHELLVYIVLLKHRDHRTGKCWPGLTTIADESRLSRRSVIRAIEGLESHGTITVKRHRNVGAKKHKPNEYTVALFNESQREWWASSVKGRRIPRRPRASSDSQSLPRTVSVSSSDTQSLGSDSQSLRVVTPSHPNKNHKNKNQEQTLTPPLARGHEIDFGVDEKMCSEKQLTLLSDLWIHASGEIPPERLIDGWQALTTDAARDLIGKYYSACGHSDGYGGPEQGTPAYLALSPTGRRWADAALVPDDYWEGVAV